MKSPMRNSFIEMLVSSLLSFIGILLVSVSIYWYLSRYFSESNQAVFALLVSPYAATAVLLYDGYQSPLSQPRNVIGSYAVCSFLGVCLRLLCGVIGLSAWLSAPLAVTVALLGMNLTNTLHPPGAACALIAVIGGPLVDDLGFGYVVLSVCGALLMVFVSVVGNNLVPTRQYPLYWI
eukprot:gene34778-42893_t